MGDCFHTYTTFAKILNVYLKVSADDDRMVVSTKEAMYCDLSSQYHGTQRVVLNKAVLLDARFKSLPFLKPEEKDDIATVIIEEVVR